MIIYTKRYVNFISIIITIPIYLILSSLNPFQENINIQSISKLLKRNLVLVKFEANNINQDTKDVENINLQNIHPSQTKEEWKITIPKISLEAEISEGTRKEVMDKYVGHFEETSSKIGNIGLAAHNRGYSVNYFSDIKKLVEGDEIIYKYQDFEKTYLVTKNIIIKDEDWSYLEDTKDNRITLITCVENEPEYRRCIQGIEKEEFEKLEKY